jgi:hypothetical protein
MKWLSNRLVALLRSERIKAAIITGLKKLLKKF